MSKILESVLQNAKALHRAGGITNVTMREFESLCVPEVKALDAKEISGLRKKLKVSQQVMAERVNVSGEFVRKWESGDRTPSGSSLRLLNVLCSKGLEVLR
ncbi:MAG: helix-turn-helix domain-containing protein [Halomonas sp.]|nr:helix-turn-helix domain-containing protein [Halomonas sp.]MBP5980041.1 helix-turn-helix domain-containing protein [Halomonas sp.]